MSQLFSGKVYYQEGTWGKDAYGKKIVLGADDVDILGRETFHNIVAVSVSQLIYILSKNIKDKKGYNFPIYISENDIEYTTTPFYPNITKRFSELQLKIGGVTG